MHRPAATPRPWHSIAWFAWAVAAAAAIQLAPSPVYVALVIGITWVIVEAHAPDGPYRRAFPILLALGAAFGVIRVLMAALTSHNGVNVWFTLPQATMPDLLGGFTVGGSVESDVVLQSAAAAFTILGVMGVFGAANTLWSHFELIQSTPRAFHELGVVVTVALAFIPATIESIRAVRDADRARTGGHAVRRGRILRTILPVLERSMERAVALSESMDSRGFGIRGPARADVEAGWCALDGTRGARDRVPRPRRAPDHPGGRVRRDRRRRARRRRVAGLARCTAPALPPTSADACRLAHDGCRRPGSPAARPHLVGRQRNARVVRQPGGLAAFRSGRRARAGPPARAARPDARPVASGDGAGYQWPHDGLGRDGLGRGGIVTGDLTYAGVSFGYPDGPAALTDVDLSVTPGDVILVVGSSGSGKSTLLRAANGLVPHSSGGRFGGEVTVSGRSTREFPPRLLADVVGFVHQDPEAQFVVDRVESDVAFGLENLGLAPTAMRRRVEEVMDALGIAHLRDRNPVTLSGGERQRCAIAGALVTTPSVLVLDEPTSQLDPQGAEDVFGAVARLNADLGTTVLIAEHRLERAAARRGHGRADGRRSDRGTAGPARAGPRRVPGRTPSHPARPPPRVGAAAADRARCPPTRA